MFGTKSRLWTQDRKRAKKEDIVLHYEQVSFSRDTLLSHSTFQSEKFVKCWTNLYISTEMKSEMNLEKDIMQLWCLSPTIRKLYVDNFWRDFKPPSQLVKPYHKEETMCNKLGFLVGFPRAADPLF